MSRRLPAAVDPCPLCGREFGSAVHRDHHVDEDHCARCGGLLEPSGIVKANLRSYHPEHAPGEGDTYGEQVALEAELARLDRLAGQQS